jgi:hypothetical protein
MVDKNRLEKVFDELQRLLLIARENPFDPSAPQIPDNIEEQIANLKQLIEIFTSTANEAIAIEGIKKEKIVSSIAHPELLTSSNKKVVVKSKELKKEIEELYKENSRKIQNNKKARAAESGANSPKSTTSTTDKRKKKFKSLGGSYWKPV